MCRLLLIALLTAVAPWAGAQRMPAASPHFARSYHRGSQSSAFLDPLSFYDYSDLTPNSEYPAFARPLIVMQSAPLAAPVPDRTPAPAEPLLIELQGDRYVRVSGAESTQIEMIDRPPYGLTEPTAIHEVVARPPTTVLLTFLDGHREEVSDYTIVGGALYASGSYYASVVWNRKIDLSSLNLPATIGSNQSRGVKFRLPASSNEVIIGP
jgi:hypothetical protein